MTANNSEQRERDRAANVAPLEEVRTSADGEHVSTPEEDGTTTRSDATDLGVPMLAAAAPERQGPEDAAGGPTRGDYSGRMGESNYNPHTTVAVENPGPNEPRFVSVPQAPMFSMTAEVPGAKGGVDAPAVADELKGKV